MRRAAPALSLALLAGCAFEFRPPSGLVGTYALSDTCRLQVDEVSAAASCDNDGTKVRVTIGDDEVSFDEVAVTETETHTECWAERICTRIYSGSVTRKSRPEEGTPYDGRFARLAGSWEGTLNMKVSCKKEQAQPSAPDWCKTSADTLTYTVSATVTDHEATVTWAGSQGAKGEFKGLETQGGVRVAETFYERIEE
jgi:hypothetical protein